MPNDVMLSLGTFMFSVDTAAYNKLRRTTEYRWAPMPRVGHRPSNQWVGVGLDEIELNGIIYPWFRGGINQIADMRTVAESGLSQLMVTGYGYSMGYWCIITVEEGHLRMSFLGTPLKQEFGLRLVYYADEIETPGTAAFVYPRQTLYGSGSVLPPPGVTIPPTPVVSPLSIAIPPIIPTQLPPLTGFTPQQAAGIMNSAIQALRAVQATERSVQQALASASMTYESMQCGLVNDPVGTMGRLLSGSSGLTTADLSVLMGGNTALVGQVGQLGVALNLSNSITRSVGSLI